jgi:glycosyltransferase involved in cell wall biosynthesis
VTFVSIIIPVYNGEKYLPTTLQSIRNQTFRATEIIAIDDGSQDRSQEVLRQVDNLTILKTDRVGPNAARQHALMHSQGQLIAFLDQDDIWHPDHLSNAVEALQQNPSASAWIGPRNTFTEKLPKLGQKTRLPHQINPAEFFPVHLIDAPSMVVVPKSKLQTVGGWPMDRPLAADMLLWWRLSTEGPFLVGKTRTTGYRYSRNSLSSQNRKTPAHYLKFLKDSAETALREHQSHPTSFFTSERSELLQAIDQLLAALNDPPAFRNSWLSLLNRLEQYPIKYRIAMLGFFGWLFSISLSMQPPAIQSTLLDGFIQPHPAITKTTHRLILQMLARIISFPRETPILLAVRERRCAIHVLALQVVNYLRTACGHIADPLSLFTDISLDRPGDHDH